MSENTFSIIVPDYIAALRAAAEFTDKNLTPEANRRTRTDMAAAANQSLRAVIAALPELGEDPRMAVLSVLSAKTADEVALQGREREKVDALLGSGKTMHEVIAQSDETRLGAILDNLEVLPEVLASSAPDAIIAEVQVSIFERLAMHENKAAATAAEAFGEWAVATAQRDVLTGIVQGGSSMAGLIALRKVDPAGYEAASGVHEASQLVADASKAARHAV